MLAPLTPVKEQILVAQDKVYSLLQKNKSKKSTSRSQRIKKLRRRIKWLNSYFLDSFLVNRPDGRKVRKLKASHRKIGKTGLSTKKYVVTCKRRRSRRPKKIHSGPYYARSSLLPPEADKDSNMITPDTCYPSSRTPLAYNPGSNSLRPKLKVSSKSPTFHLSKALKASSGVQNSNHKDPPKTMWLKVLVSKRLAVIIRKAPSYRPINSIRKSKPLPTPLRSLMIRDLNGYLTPCWVSSSNLARRVPQSIITWAREIQQRLFLKNLGCNVTSPPIPSKFKLLKVPLNQSPRPSKYTKTRLRRKLQDLFPPRLPKNYLESFSSVVAAINPSSSSSQPSSLTPVDTLLPAYGLGYSPTDPLVDPSDPLSPSVADDTPPLVDYWSDSSSDCSDDTYISDAFHKFEFVGSGPKSRKTQKKTVAGVFRPLSSYWPAYPSCSVKPPKTPSHTSPTNPGPPPDTLKDNGAPPTQNSSTPHEADCLRYPAQSVSDPLPSPNCNFNPIDRNALKAVAATISCNALSIIKEMDLTIVALGSHGRASILYSSSLLKHWVML